MLTNPKHRDNAFDLIRFLAALSVLFSHSFATTGLPEPTYYGGETAGSLGVFVFFAVSGYLVQQSWDRQPTPSSFALSRILRIFPGLLVCLFFCAFVLGPIATSFPINTYLLNSDVYKFIYSNLAMFFVPRFDTLPGVFIDNAFPNHVNSSLWTIRYEVFMYVVLLTTSMLFRKAGVVVAVLLLCFCGVWFYGKYAGLADPGQLLWRLDVVALDGRILKLAPFFLVGVLIAKMKQEFLSVRVATVAFVITAFFYGSPNAIVLLWFTLPYCLIVLAYNTPARLNKFGRHGDFSYGLYLYAFPVQQILANLAISTINWWTGFIATFAFALILAVLSWRFVESPALRVRSTLMAKIRQA
jgi:peptidoglycan/LPS O-acetylase OafA/YrhL